MLKTRLIRLVTSIHILLYRWTHGRIGGSVRGTPLLLLTTTGRKSGNRRTMPVGYFMDGADYIITALYTSFRPGKKPGWLYNLTRTPEVTIQVKGDRLAAVAHQADEDERPRLRARFAEISRVWPIGCADFAT